MAVAKGKGWKDLNPEVPEAFAKRLLKVAGGNKKVAGELVRLIDDEINNGSIAPQILKLAEDDKKAAGAIMQEIIKAIDNTK